VTRRAVEFSCAVMITGLLAGLAGAATYEALHFIEHAAYGYSFGTLLSGVGNSPPLRRVLVPVLGGAMAGLGWWAIRRRNQVPALSAVIGGEPMPRLQMAADAVLQVLVVGFGASLGREGAPRQLAAVFSEFGMSRLSLTARDREILLACAAGAGLGAVYSVPVGGAFFAARVLLNSWHPRVVGTALITSSLAVAVSFPVTHFEQVLTWPDPSLTYQFAILAVAIAPLSVSVGLVFNKLVSLAQPHPQLRSWLLVPGIALAGLIIGVCSIYLPELPGNGRSILSQTIGANVGLSGAVALLVLKPLLTALYLRVGAVGGLITPALATGASAGAVVTLVVNDLAHTHLQVAAMALTSAAGVLAVTMRAPTFAALFAWELARPPEWLFLVFAIAAFAARGLQWLREQHRDTVVAWAAKSLRVS
jgi:H+/Cl- antiporter ClcA